MIPAQLEVFSRVESKVMFRVVCFRCKKHDVPIEKIYNKTQRDKFRWAIDMAGPDYVF